MRCTVRREAREISMANTISFDRANSEFHGAIKAGEWVAYWISDDRQASMAAVIGS